jgi:zinc protease
MIARLRRKFVFLVSVIVAATCLASAQQPAATPRPQTDALTTTIPVDPQITVGKFANGLTYYIRQNKKPEGRAELRLAVNAGSILEDNDQRGLAHFVEHMAFNGTKNFPKMEVVNFLQSIGMQFGAHVNAYTSFDETVYMLQVPTDKPDVLDKSFLVLEDWARNVTFDPAEIEKERGVVMEEWRLGRGAQSRITDKQLPVLLQGSRYAERLPIGTPEVLQGAKPERLTTFYKDWYRPDMMAIVAVGDFDKAAIEAMIKKHFEPIPAAARNAKTRTMYPVPDHPGTLYSIVADKEMPQAEIEIISKVETEEATTIGKYRGEIVNGLFSSLLNARFSEMTRKPDAPFLGAGAGVGHFVRTKDARTLNAGVKEDGIARGLDALLTEAERVARFGFTQTELDRAKANLARALERAVLEKDNSQSSSLAAEFIRNFLAKEPIPGIVYENELYKRFLPEIALAEINALARNWTPNRNRVVVAVLPDKPGLAVPTETQLTAVMSTAADKPLTAYVDTIASAPLLATPPAPGTITKTDSNAAYGITTWELSNGVKVVMKPTNFKEDEILFTASSPGGTSLASDADYVPALTAAQVVGMGGVGQLSQDELQRVMAGKVVNVSASIGETSEGVSGSASPKDLETMFQMIYLRITQPRLDRPRFEAMVAQTKAAMANQTVTPAFGFNQTLNSTLYQNHPRRQIMTLEKVNEMNLDKSLAFYKERFADVSDMTFTFVGTFTLDAMRPMVERYLASLPSTKRVEKWKDIGVRPVTGVVVKTVEKGIEPRSQTVMVFTGPFGFNQTNRVAIRAMQDVLTDRLRESMREDLGATYGVSVSPSYRKIPREEYELRISFGSSPTRVDELVKVVLQQIEDLKTKGVTPAQAATTREKMLRSLESDTKTNGFYLTNVSARLEHEEEMASLFNLADFYNKITPEMIQEAAKTYLNTNNYVVVELFPEKR